MTRFVSLNGVTKSVLMWEIHPEHRLSTPTGAESVSNITPLSYDILVALNATTAIAIAMYDVKGGSRRFSSLSTACLKR
jgi:hypothetical protein